MSNRGELKVFCQGELEALGPSLSKHPDNPSSLPSIFFIFYFQYKAFLSLLKQLQRRIWKGGFFFFFFCLFWFRDFSNDVWLWDFFLEELRLKSGSCLKAKQVELNHLLRLKLERRIVIEAVCAKWSSAIQVSELRMTRVTVLPFGVFTREEIEG